MAGSVRSVGRPPAGRSASQPPKLDQRVTRITFTGGLLCQLFCAFLWAGFLAFVAFATFCGFGGFPTLDSKTHPKPQLNHTKILNPF